VDRTKSLIVKDSRLAPWSMQFLFAAATATEWRTAGTETLPTTNTAISSSKSRGRS
jgi:hypothetical protein